MIVDPPRGPRAALTECAGQHPMPAAPNAEVLEWQRLYPPLEPARLKDHTCDRCRTVSYELLSRGQYLIRRTDRTSSAVAVSETDSVPRKYAEAWWQALLHGRAV